MNSETLEARVSSFASEVYGDIAKKSAGIFEAEYYTQKLLGWAMHDEEFKVSLFRFVDVLPALQDAAAVVSHGQEYFCELADRFPGFLNWGLLVNPSSIPARVISRLVRAQVRAVAEKFIIGADARSALKTLRRIRAGGTAFTIDLLGEATVSEPEAQVYLERYLELLHTLRAETPQWGEAAPLISGHVGERSPINISVKLSALYSQSRALNADRSVTILTERLAQILSVAKELGAFVYVDMEDSSLTDITLRTFREALSSTEFRSYERCGIVLQAYLRRTGADLDELIRWTKTRGTPIGVRLVKGAYWDSETILAKQHGWPIPVWQKKSSTDAAYEELAHTLLRNSGLIYPAFGSHNIRSLSFAALAAESLQIPPTNFEFQVLYGMAEPIQNAFVERGFLVRQYAPVGDLITGMGYLVRRLLENTSNEGFLRLGLHTNGAEGAQANLALLAKPQMEDPRTETAHIVRRPREVFTNTPLADFSLAETRDQFRDALAAVLAEANQGPTEISPVLSGIRVRTAKTFDALLVEDRSVVLARVSAADIPLTEQAVMQLSDFFPKWRDTPVDERTEVLFQAAELLESRRMEFAALMVLEEGKQWAEADGDVAEAIDFCNYYAREAKRLFQTRELESVPRSGAFGGSPGERNQYFYEPRGVTAVISPWNFPLAIPCGMFAAALVTGNTVLLKPAEQSTLVAYRMFQLFLEAGMPPSAACFLPGYGEEVGPILVNHPLVTTIAFTGSRDVGMQIVAQAAESSNGAQHVKRVIAEMGGKNAIIVDDDADLDEAVKGVIHSAFGYQGQKCSACSRAIVVDSAYERFLVRLSEATKSIISGPASDPSTLVGPVIDQEAYERILHTIEAAKLRCKLVAKGPQPSSTICRSPLIAPVIFADIPPGDPILRQEIFGPVLAVLRAKDFEDALRIALDSEYALTGAVFSRSPEHIEKAMREFRVGNLYINRGCTGALVHRQPFGGARMSGVGSKAGGPDYLQQFVIPRAISENTIRRGFAPESK